MATELGRWGGWLGLCVVAAWWRSPWFACFQGRGGPWIFWNPPPSPPTQQWVDNQPTNPQVEDSLLQRRTGTPLPPSLVIATP